MMKITDYGRELVKSAIDNCVWRECTECEHMFLDDPRANREITCDDHFDVLF